MHIGSLVIAADLLGFITDEVGDMYVVKDKHGVEHKVLKKCCNEISNPYALSLLVLGKLKGLVSR